MTTLEIIIIAIVEAMDCLAVAVSTGLCKSQVRFSRAFLQAISFGVFQGGMTLLGYFLGSFAERWFSAIGTPIACTILCVLGLRMIWGAIKGCEETTSCTHLSLMNILLLSIATSIDAFTVGISFAFMNVDMPFAVSAIAIASFAMGVIGFEIGRHASKRFKTKIPEIIAGIILIAIGVKMVV
jgi:putative Mn2+ efflux pump MntP